MTDTFQLVHSDLTGNTLINNDAEQSVVIDDYEYEMLKRPSISDYMLDRSRYYEYEKFDDISTAVLPEDKFIEPSQQIKKTTKVRNYFNNIFSNNIWSNYKRNKSNSSALSGQDAYDVMTLNDEKMDDGDDIMDLDDDHNDLDMEPQVLNVNPRKVFSSIDNEALTQNQVFNFHSIINEVDDQFYIHNNPYQTYERRSNSIRQNESIDEDWNDQEDNTESQYSEKTAYDSSTTNSPGGKKIRINGLPPRTRGRKPSLVPDLSKQFGCEFCDRRFKRQEHLKRHIRSLHMGEKPYECHICNKKFSRSDNLNQHIKTHSH
ncbi:Zinc finger C2H2 type domain signature [Nakaseomyces glabratus]|nr:Zinc finger C2H2 type domain signature [Nakaseomyces glabratus]